MSTGIWIILALLLLAALLFLRSRRQHKQPYQAATARIEGGGVKRGLTPPEGAVLLGKPLNITLTLVIFEMLRKGFLVQTAVDPLTVELAEDLRTLGKGLSVQGRGDLRRQAAQRIPAALQIYEEPFLEIIEAHPGVPVKDLDLGVAVQPLVRYVASRVSGYGLDETREYYRLIIERAPREARSDGKLTFERQKIFDRNFGWVLLGDDFGAVLDDGDYSYLPVWLRRSKQPLAGQSFASWAAGVIASLEGAVDETDVKVTLGHEEDATTAALLGDISRATFYG